MSYNALWCVAYTYASNHGMTIHRVEQFAADYAFYHEVPPVQAVISPEAFLEIASSLDYHYHP